MTEHDKAWEAIQKVARYCEKHYCTKDNCGFYATNCDEHGKIDISEPCDIEEIKEPMKELAKYCNKNRNCYVNCIFCDVDEDYSFCKHGNVEILNFWKYKTDIRDKHILLNKKLNEAR